MEHSDPRHWPRCRAERAVRRQRRWAIAERRLIRERRVTPVETKLCQLAVLMASASEMGWSGPLDAEDDAMRARWMALRRATLAGRWLRRPRVGSSGSSRPRARGGVGVARCYSPPAQSSAGPPLRSSGGPASPSGQSPRKSIVTLFGGSLILPCDERTSDCRRSRRGSGSPPRREAGEHGRST